MTRELTFDGAPSLGGIYAKALVTGHATDGDLPDVVAVRKDISADPSHVADFARATGFTLGNTLPLPYPHLLTFPLQMALMSARAFPLALIGSVHLRNTIVQTRPIGITESFDLTVRAANLRPHAKGRQVDLVSEANIDGDVVWQGTSTYLSMGRGADSAASDPADQPPSLDEVTAVRAGLTWRLGDSTGRDWAKISGDWNPIHLHPLTAKPLGFPTAIAHGVYTYSRAYAALAPALPDAGVTSRVWFRKPVRLPSTVQLRSVIAPGRTVSLLSGKSIDLEHAIIENTW